jgi:apolipoprotein D and lipocalin family protein
MDQDNYQYAFVSGPDKSYLWFLSRTPVVSEELKKHFIEQAKLLGFDTSNLIFVRQNANL